MQSHTKQTKRQIINKILAYTLNDNAMTPEIALGFKGLGYPLTKRTLERGLLGPFPAGQWLTFARPRAMQVEQG